MDQSWTAVARVVLRVVGVVAFRVVLALRDKTLPSVVIGLDRALRRFGGAPTYALTDNEKTVSVDHVCGIAVRNPQVVSVARHYGLTIATCVPADPQSKGGSEATVRVARADLVPTDHNLRPAYESFAELELACEEWMAHVNTRPAPGDAGAAGRAAGRGARALASAPESAAHGLFRGDAEGQLAVVDLGRSRALLGRRPLACRESGTSPASAVAAGAISDDCVAAREAGARDVRGVRQCWKPIFTGLLPSGARGA